MTNEQKPTEPPLNIYQRMLAVMRDVSYVQKGDKKVNNQYSFVSHDAVTAKLRGAFVEHGIVAPVSVTKHAQDGNRTDVDVEVSFVNVDNPEDRIVISAFGYGIDPQDKGPGKAVSYAVKYAFLKAFSLETGDDPERDSINHDPGNKSNGEKPHGVQSAGMEKHTAGQTAVDAFEALPDDERKFLQGEALKIIAFHEDSRPLMPYIDGARYQTEELLALWSLLPSKVRSAIKREKQIAALQPAVAQP